MMLKLDKVNRGPHLSTLVASSISREIAQGRLKPGDQLPTEQALAQTFGVSRNVVREAIARLRSEGRIWSQQGRGAFVADAQNTTVLTIDHDSLQEADAFKNLFEIRGILEVEIAGIAAQRRTDADIDAMKEALATMAAAPYGSVTWLKTDLEFHRTVASATQNSYMAPFLMFASERVRDSILASGHQQRSDDLASITLGEHQSILDAIAAGDVDGARRAMTEHLAGAARRVGLPAATVDPDGADDHFERES
ncbi:DNA-binding FadR family transcriptional regulator [Shinella sp. BE166]|uniref:FadR/GntR family transcriptional regulator n=1 Tax=Shinella sp. BE166 TaxID=3373918 RepID=UPI003EB9DBF0